MNTQTSTEQDLNVVFEDLYRELNILARYIREGRSAEDQAQHIENLALVLCKHWPNCRDAHNLAKSG